VHAANVDRHGTSDSGPARHDVDQAAKGQTVLQSLDRGGARTEVHDVVESLTGEVGDVGGYRNREARRLDGLTLSGVGQKRRHVGRSGSFEQRADAFDSVARVRDHEQPPAREWLLSLAIDVRRLDARPRLDQRDRRCARLLANRNEETFVGSGLDDHPLVEQHVLLEPALKVVAEGGVGGLRREVAIVGLDQAPLAELVAANLVAHGDDVTHRLVPGDGRQSARRIRWNLGQHFRRQPRENLALARVAGERVQELGIGEADPDRFHLYQDLVRARLRDGLGAVVDGSAGVHDLDRMLGGGNGPLLPLASDHACLLIT
jgi:hypothetical protein